jgi:hypothetical protein
MPQLKREQSLAARFGRADTSYYDISSTWIADGFLSSSPMTPARQTGLRIAAFRRYGLFQRFSDRRSRRLAEATNNLTPV